VNVPSNSIKPDLVYDCPACGERVEVVGITWEWVYQLMSECYTSRGAHVMRQCQLHMLQMSLLLMLNEQQTLTVSEQATATIIVKELDARKRSLPAAEGSQVQQAIEGYPR